MAPFIDPKMNQLMNQYYGSDSNPKFLYDGSQEQIVKELQAWVVRRQKVSQEQMELREKIFESTLTVKTSTTTARHEAALAEGVRSLNRSEVSNTISGKRKYRHLLTLIDRLLTMKKMKTLLEQHTSSTR